MTLREQIEQRRRQWAEFNRWESEQSHADRSASEIIADVDVILSWLPPDIRTHDEDPDKLGIQAMRAALARLRPR